MFWFLLPIIILTLLYFSFKKMRLYVNKYWGEIIINLTFVFLGAYGALQLTIQQNQRDEKENYSSIVKSCENMNNQYIKTVVSIINSLSLESDDFTEKNSFVKNTEQPFLFEEILKNSNLYKYSSIHFKNWLPSIIFFLKETNWTISANSNSLYFNIVTYQYLLYINELITIEQKFLSEDLSEEEVKALYKTSIKKIENSLLNIPQQFSKIYSSVISNNNIKQEQNKSSTLKNNILEKHVINPLDDRRTKRLLEDFNDSSSVDSILINPLDDRRTKRLLEDFNDSSKTY